MNKNGLIFLAAILLIFFGSMSSASAADLRFGEEYSMPESEIVSGDLYISGGNITVSGTVRGDLLSAGGNILVNGSVTGDVLLFGGSVSIVGKVGDDVRVVGGQVVIGEDVGGDLIIVGGMVHLLSNATVRGDIILVGGRTVIDGNVRGEARMYGGDIVINGTIAGDVNSALSNSLVIKETALIGGNLTYAAPQEGDIATDARIQGETTFTETRATKDVETFVGTLFGVLFIAKILMLLTTGLLAVLVFQKYSQAVVEHAVESLGREALRGFIILIITPILLVFFFLTTIGFFLGLLGSLIFISLIIVAKVYAGIIVGAFIASRVQKQVLANWQWAILGITLLQIVSLVPILGFLVTFISFLIALGTLSYFAYREFWLKRSDTTS